MRLVFLEGRQIKHFRATTRLFIYFAEAISENTRLVLANAIFFKGKWKIPFDPSQSDEMDFTLANGQVKRTQFMHGVGKYRAGKFDGATFIVLPYEVNKMRKFYGILLQQMICLLIFFSANTIFY